LTLGPGIYTRIEKCPKQASIAQQYAQQLIVINIYIVKPSGVKEIVPIDKNRDTPSMAELPRRTRFCIKLHLP
jgi:hypothetical protein